MPILHQAKLSKKLAEGLTDTTKKYLRKGLCGALARASGKRPHRRTACPLGLGSVTLLPE